MADEDVLDVGRLAAHLAVKVETARGQATLADDGAHDLPSTNDRPRNDSTNVNQSTRE